MTMTNPAVFVKHLGGSPGKNPRLFSKPGGLDFLLGSRYVNILSPVSRNVAWSVEYMRGKSVYPLR
jgi:hypothetical protein